MADGFRVHEYRAEDFLPRDEWSRRIWPSEANGDSRANAGKQKKSDPRYSGLVTLDNFMAAMRPPEYLVDGVLQRGMTYALTGLTGAGKTALTLLLSTCVDRGEAFCGRETARGSVVFLAGENPDNVRWQTYALLADLGLGCTSLPGIHVHDGSFSIEAAIERLACDAAKIPNLTLVVADTMQAFFQGDNDNDNVQMIQAARDFRSLTELPGKPTVLIPCHPAKTARRDNMVPRGGSSFLNEIDGNVAAWCEDDIVELYRHGKHRGVPYDPLRFRLVRTEPDGLVDGKGRQMPGTVARPMLAMEAEQAAREAETRENRALDFIRRNPRASSQALGDALGCHKSTAARLIVGFKGRKWVKSKGRALVLTSDGDAALNG